MKKLLYIIPAILITACNNNAEYDAQGTFEATEITISAEATGKILEFNVTEGETIRANEVVGTIDSTQLHLQRKQLAAQQASILSNLPDKEKQVSSLRKQIAAQKRELQRTENMLKDGAATEKQYNDIESHVNILEGQLTALLSTLENNAASINGNAAALEAQITALDDRIAKCSISSSSTGTVLVKYAQAGEFAAAGKPLMKIADLENIHLRAYFTSSQLANVQLNDTVTVTADFGGDQRYEYEGKVIWISAESEFTPKNIQTRDSRANLVYAVKIAVKNDGRLKLGLAGEVKL